MTRFTIAILVSGGALGLVGLVLNGTVSDPVAGILGNVGTELLGIAVTVAVVDFLLEQRRLNEEVRRIAAEALDQVDHAVWVWQGDQRDFDLSELLARLDIVEETDPLPDFTQSLFIVLGSRASNTLRTRLDLVDRSPALRKGLAELKHVAAIRDGGSLMKPSEISSHIACAVPHLAEAAGLPMPEPAKLVHPAHRLTSVDHQVWRHFGRDET